MALDCFHANRKLAYSKFGFSRTYNLSNIDRCLHGVEPFLPSLPLGALPPFPSTWSKEKERIKRERERVKERESQ